MADKFKQDALEYHRHPVPEKLAITATKPLAARRDRAPAYSPRIAAACNANASTRAAVVEGAVQAPLQM